MGTLISPHAGTDRYDRWRVAVQWKISTVEWHQPTHALPGLACPRVHRGFRPSTETLAVLCYLRGGHNHCISDNF
eukprot:NODE_23204_length_676_cov_3.426230.p3 GENE.NODE_23204_length_676_cov_3.426230~~NODE_23204_length_676_cov_3.426230.p3  ORF type:complete len:75 (+),score=4.62 NODE_23204_length_676_cov_3.426230:440-664(+)